MSEATKPHWYLVQARPQQAALAVEHLERQGYCVFDPRLHVEQLPRVVKQVFMGATPGRGVPLVRVNTVMSWIKRDQACSYLHR